MKRVGIFSGTFDPVHSGHVRFATEALNRCILEKIFFLVEPRPRRKQGIRALEHRIKMVQLALHDEPKLGIIQLEQARFSVLETLPLLKNRFADAQLHMLVGDDVIMHMAEWPHVDELVNNMKFIIGARTSLRDIQRHIKTIEQTRGLNFEYELFKTKLSADSSSKARAKVRLGHLPGELHPAVYDYIKANGLYASTDGAS